MKMELMSIDEQWAQLEKIVRSRQTHSTPLPICALLP